MHVYHIYPALFGGASRVVHQLAKELSKRGHKVAILSTNAHSNSGKEYENDNGVDVYRFRLFSKRLSEQNIMVANIQCLSWTKKILLDFDCVHLHGYRTFQNVFVHHYATKSGVPYVLQAHGTLPRTLAKQRLKLIYDALFGYRVLRDASKVIALSQMEAQQYRAMGVPEEKIEVIPNGIDLSEYANLPPKGSFRKEFDIHNDDKIILYLGRIHNTKGIDFLVKAYAYLIRNAKHNNAMLVIAGPDDGYLSKAKELASSLGISSHVLFPGFLAEEEKICAYVDSSLVVSPERFNVFLLVPLEAAACGKSVIVSTTNHISHMVRKEGFGFSVKYGDTEELAEVMGKILNNNDLATQMGQKGRKFIFGNCDWARVVGKLEPVYEEIVK